MRQEPPLARRLDDAAGASGPSQQRVTPDEDRRHFPTPGLDGPGVAAADGKGVASARVRAEGAAGIHEGIIAGGSDYP